MSSKLRLGVAGPVGSGKTALVEALCRRLRDELQLAVVTNDIYTCLLYTSPSPRDKRQSRMPSSA